MAKNLTLYCLLIWIGCLPLFKLLKAQSPPQNIADSLQSILDNSLQSGFTHPGVIMTVTAPGAWTWTGASGHAISGQTSGQPLALASPSMQFRVGSITKNMVAACVLKLEQGGFLNINDPIDLYLRPTLINDTLLASDTIRIRHLLNHTSGIANSASNTSCQLDVLTNPTGSHTLEEAVACGASLGELFSPGTGWSYSNTNYSLLAMIIQSVTGQSYVSYLDQIIFQPLGLPNTEVPANVQITDPHMGCYWFTGQHPWTDLTVIHPTTYTGWADVVSTTTDLIIYYSALRNGGILDSTEWAVMQTIDAVSFDYGMGLDFYQISGVDYVGHYGEVGNTSGLFFASISSPVAPNGYYIAYNFNTQGADMQNMIDVPVMDLLKNATVSRDEPVSLELDIAPNPASSGTRFSFRPGEVDEIRISDMLGRQVAVYMPESSEAVWDLDVSRLAQGGYWITASGANGKASKLLFVE